MKDVRVTTATGSSGCSFMLFPTSLSLRVWFDKPALTASADIVILRPHEFIEAEWCGCEYVFNGNDHNRMDFIRFAKAHRPENSAGLVASIYFGWLPRGVMPFNDYVDDEIVVKRLVGNNRIDLRALFKDVDDDEK